METFRKRLLEFLFPPETDHWLAILRVGLGVEVMVYSLSLRNDWTYLLSGTVRRLAEALLSLESHLIPRLGWFATLAAQFGVDENRITFRCVGFFACSRLRPSHRTRLSSLSDSGVVSSPLRSKERWIRLVWIG